MAKKEENELEEKLMKEFVTEEKAKEAELKKLEAEKTEQEEESGSSKAKLFLSGCGFEESVEERKKRLREKRQLNFEDATKENFQTVYDELIGIWNLLVDFYQKSEPEFLSREHVEKVLGDGKKIVEEIVKVEQEKINDLKARLIEVIKMYAREKRNYEKAKEHHLVWVKRFMDTTNKVASWRDDRDRLVKDLTDFGLKYNKLIVEHNKEVAEHNRIMAEAEKRLDKLVFQHSELVKKHNDLVAKYNKKS